jgi:hypothetical protein
VSDPSGWSPAAFQSSCFDGWRELLRAFEGHSTWPTLSELETTWLRARGITTQGGAPLRPVRDAKPRRRKKDRPVSEEYDLRVARGELPTRERSWHDFFNVGAFTRFPRIKAIIHAQNARALEAERAKLENPLEKRRSRFRDTRALLDEGGLLLATRRDVAEDARNALEAGDMARLRAMAADGSLRPWVLGHALLEHAARSAVGERLGVPPRGLTWVVACDPHDVSELDVAFADELERGEVLREPPHWIGHTLDNWFADVPGSLELTKAPSPSM